MAFTDRGKDFKSGSDPLGAPAQPAAVSNTAAGASAGTAAARQITTTAPALHLFSEKKQSTHAAFHDAFSG